MATMDSAALVSAVCSGLLIVAVLGMYAGAYGAWDMRCHRVEIMRRDIDIDGAVDLMDFPAFIFWAGLWVTSLLLLYRTIEMLLILSVSIAPHETVMFVFMAGGLASFAGVLRNIYKWREMAWYGKAAPLQMAKPESSPAESAPVR